jgi:hypothetical protein
VRGELAVELADERQAVGEPKLGAGGGERGGRESWPTCHPICVLGSFIPAVLGFHTPSYTETNLNGGGFGRWSRSGFPSQQP